MVSIVIQDLKKDKLMHINLSTKDQKSIIGGRCTVTVTDGESTGTLTGRDCRRYYRLKGKL